MEWNTLKSKFESDSSKIFSWLNGEYDKIRSGRINITIFNSVIVNYYDVPTPLNQLANIQILDAKTVIVKPYDRSVVKDTVNALQNANLGCNVQNEDVQIKLAFPAQTEENRRNNVKKAKVFLETAKQRIRDVRQDVQKIYKKETGLSEDVLKNFEEELNKITKTTNSKLEEVFANKEKELMKI
jgi:ribosome recycling factor